CLVPQRLEERCDDEGRRPDQRYRMAGQGRLQCGAFAGNYVAFRQKNDLWPAAQHRRWRRGSGRGGAMMRGLPLPLLIQLVSSSWAPAQAKAVANGVPRAADGKPDLTGVWQGGSNVRGAWQEANSGLGLGGNGTNPAVTSPRSASERAPGESAPYQPWAAQKVVEMYNRRGIDDPVALCMPPGPTRAATQGLFPIEFVQTPKQITILYEYMNTFRIIPLDAQHPDDLTPAYMGNSVGHWE